MNAGFQTVHVHERFHQLLNEDLNEQDEQAVIIHLSECESCRKALEEQAAAEPLWEEVKRSLLNREEVPIFDEGNPLERSSQIETVIGMLAPTDDPHMLGRLGGYEISGVIGAGAMGVVLKGYDRSLDRIVAVKVMAPHLASSGSSRKRFAREAKAVAAVLHPNVMAVHGVSNDEGLPYLVMPYFAGMSLQKRIEAEGPLSTEEVLRIGAQIASGLAAAHNQGIIHRDIKPANVLLEEGVERVVITDFGLARAVDDATMTRSGLIAGTPQYMSPEQARGEAIDQSSDLFSLGSVLYALCTGHSPFRAETTYAVLRRIIDEQPRPIREINPEIPEWMCAIIERMLTKNPSDRLSSAKDVADLLERCLAHIQQPTDVMLPQSVSQMIATHERTANRKTDRRPRPRTGGRKIIGGIGLAILIGGLLVWFTQTPEDDSFQSNSLAGQHPQRRQSSDDVPKAAAGKKQGSNEPAEKNTGTGTAPPRIEPSLRDTNSVKEPAYQALRRVSVMALEFSDDGQKLITLSVPTDIPTNQKSFAIRIWNAEKRRLSQEIDAICEIPVRAKTLTLCQNRQRVLAATDQCVGIWDAANGTLLKKLKLPQWEHHCVAAVSCTPDLSWVAATWIPTYIGPKTWDSVALVWKVADGAEPRILTQKNQRDYTSISLSSDGKLLATTNQFSARIWDTSTGEDLYEYEGEWEDASRSKLSETRLHNTLGSVRFSPDGRQLAISSQWGVTLIDVRSRKIQKQIVSPFGVTRDGTHRIVYSPDGSRLARMGTFFDGAWQVPIWSSRSGATVHRLKTKSFDGNFSKNGMRFAVGLYDRAVGFHVWKLNPDGAAPTPMNPRPE